MQKGGGWLSLSTLARQEMYPREESGAQTAATDRWTMTILQGLEDLGRHDAVSQTKGL